MSRQQQIKDVILEILHDGKTHTASEIQDMAFSKGIIKNKKDPAVRNAIFVLKKSYPGFVSPRAGYYYIENENVNNTESTNNLTYVAREIRNMLKQLKTVSLYESSEVNIEAARKQYGIIKELGIDINKFVNDQEKLSKSISII